MTIASSKTYNGLTAAEINCCSFDQLLNDVIMGHTISSPQRFLEWLIERDCYYVKRLATDEMITKAQVRMHFSCDYSNADIDWRVAVREFIMDNVPARLWWAYGCKVAEELRTASN